MRALLVDDDKYWSHGFLRYLQLVERWDVKYESSLSSAVQTISGAFQSVPGTLDVILLDVMMPTEGRYTPEESDDGLLTGVLLARQINREAGGRACIVLLTARQDLTTWIGSEVSGYILKTKTPREIAEEVRRIVRQRKQPKNSTSESHHSPDTPSRKEDR